MNLLSLLFTCGALAQTQTALQDLHVNRQFGVGTSSPTIALQIISSSITVKAARIASTDDMPIFELTPAARVGLGSAPVANLDIYGIATESTTAVELRSGVSFPGDPSHQIAFAYNNLSIYRHTIRSLHTNASVGNGLEFYLWSSADAAEALGTTGVLSLLTISTGASVHVMPAGTPDVELEVSNASTTGGGTVHRALEGTHSTRKSKRNIRYLSHADEDQAAHDVLSLKHATYRYKGSPKNRRHVGLIFEEAPTSIRGTGNSIVVDERLTNAELAFKALIRRVRRTREEIDLLKGAQ